MAVRPAVIPPDFSAAFLMCCRCRRRPHPQLVSWPYTRLHPPPRCLQPWKDTSAGAIAAAGLLRLSTIASTSAAAVKYQAAALAMLEVLATSYLSNAASPGSPRLASILRNGTVSAPSGMYGTGTIFGDYYFLEALHAAYGRQGTA